MVFTRAFQHDVFLINKTFMKATLSAKCLLTSIAAERLTTKKEEMFSSLMNKGIADALHFAITQPFGTLTECTIYAILPFGNHPLSR